MDAGQGICRTMYSCVQSGINVSNRAFFVERVLKYTLSNIFQS